MQHLEFELQRSICRYLDAQYPSVLYMSDTVASVKLTVVQGVRNKSIQKRGFKTPDLIVFKPNSQYHGLFIELKINTPFKQNGEIKASSEDRLILQGETLKQLRELGYMAEFAWGFEMAKGMIDKYLKIK